jgi:hypothetical protein
MTDKLNDTTIETTDNMAEILTTFIDVSKEDLSADQPSYDIQTITTASNQELLCYRDSRGFDWAMIAAADGLTEVINQLLARDFDLNDSFKGESAINLAYEREHFDVVLMLLQNNSKFPQNFDAQCTNHAGLIEFARVMKKFHKKIAKSRKLDVDDIEKYKKFCPKLKHFFSVDEQFFNQSAAFVALKLKNNYNHQLMKAYQITMTWKEAKKVNEENVNAASGVEGVLFRNNFAANDEALENFEIIENLDGFRDDRTCSVRHRKKVIFGFVLVFGILHYLVLKTFFREGSLFSFKGEKIFLMMI